MAFAAGTGDWRRTLSPQRHGGFTLVEVLLAIAIGGVLVVGVTRALSGDRRSARVTTERSDAQLSLDLAADLLGRELRRAGYVPYAPGAASVVHPWPVALRIVLRPGRAAGDTIEIRSIEDRLVTGPVARDLSFEAGIDGRGEPQLYRESGTGSRQPLVSGVAGLTVAGWVDVSGFHARALLVPGSLRPTLLTLRLVAGGSGSTRTFAVPLASHPATRVELGR